MSSNDDMICPSERASCLNSEYEDKDYCRYTAERSRELWEIKKVFKPEDLRHYGVRSDRSLIHFFDHARLLNASFGTFPLGFTPEVEGMKAVVQDLKNAHGPETEVKIWNIPAHLSLETEGRRFSHESFHPGLSLLDPIINDTSSEGYVPRRLSMNGSKSVKEDMCRLWGTMQESPVWAKSTCGVVTIPHWGTTALRNRARQQLLLAAFMGLFAVQVPLPLLHDEGEPHHDANAHEGDARSQKEQSLTTARNWALLGHVRDELVSFIQTSNGVKIWVRCDACQPEHLAQYQRLHQLMLYGYECDPVSKEAIGPHRGITVDNATEVVCREAITSLMPMLYFSDTQKSIITAWLGEDVGVFEPPPAEQLFRLLPSIKKSSNTKAELSHGQSPVRFESSESWNSYSIGIASSRDNHSEHASRDIGSDKKDEGVDRRIPASSHADPCISCTENKVAVQSVLKDDLLARDTARWGGLYPPRVSLVTFLLELMRRRGAPLFSFPLFDDYAIMNWLYSREVVDPTREQFGGYEDTLQLPLQPLSQPLPNAVYHIFECDSTKYSLYHDAIFLFLRDWASRDPALFHHGLLNKRLMSSITVGVGANGNDVDHEGAVVQAGKTVYIVLLGCGRGGIVDEIISVASTLDLRLRLFAIEKNPPAAELARLRWLCDPVWSQQAATFGHTLEVIIGDGRYLFEESDSNELGVGSIQLPDDFGICDLLVAEMLGSFGDNELSPECIDAFYNQLLRLQAVKGITPNKNLVCIPQSYTTWVAPLHSTRIEQCVLDTAIRGLTVRPERCTNRHVAIFSSPLVSNYSRGVLLTSPQACWTFSHLLPASPRAEPACGSSYERRCTLRFRIPENARCSGMAGFFSCVLYHSEVDGKEVIMSTEPRSRTPGMYSWFPGFLPLDPSLQLQALDGASEIVFSFYRHIDEKERRVWYSWGVEDNSGSARCDCSVGHSNDHKQISEGNTMRLLNEGGWAASMTL
ncbi:unnamed protein product [Phytomonas sp. EM1]|nr:unnamed protein product [Phytomonas sp. EM1]|eukprot:CCW62937.1 unnamed protein product [Phytomonas sp. isolate EM1]